MPSDAGGMDSPSVVVVRGAGRQDVDGTYVPHDRKYKGQEVFRKPGTSLTVLRRGDDSWSIADFGAGAETLRFSPKASELYAVGRCEEGVGAGQPPEVGWEVLDAPEPAPAVVAWRSGNRTRRLRVEFALPRNKCPGADEGSAAEGGGPQLSGRAHSAPSLPKLPAVLTRRRGKLPTLSVFTSPFEAMGAFTAAPRPPPAGHDKLLFAFSVLLARPDPRTGWGFDWNQQAYVKNGCRSIHTIHGSSPLGRWNTWQGLRGRPDLKVCVGDQLLKADGKWSFAEVEVCADDVGEETMGPSEGSSHRYGGAIMDFGRWVVRPSRPPAPRIDTWQQSAGLRVSWVGAAAAAEVAGPLGWALCLRDTELGQWYAVDGATGRAEKVLLSKDVSAVHPEESSVVIYDGLFRGRSYVACIAVLTNFGWSSFSFLSKPGTTSTTMHGSRSQTRLASLAQLLRRRGGGGEDGEVTAAPRRTRTPRPTPPHSCAARRCRVSCRRRRSSRGPPRRSCSRTGLALCSPSRGSYA